VSLANSGNLADSEGDNGDAENDDEVNINRIPALEVIYRPMMPFTLSTNSTQAGHLPFFWLCIPLHFV
jgi:hypothetical protein